MTDQRFILRHSDVNRERIFTNMTAFLGRLPELKSWEVIVRPYRKARTDPQNHALFGVAYPALMAHCGYQGEADKLELHRVFCGEFFGWVEFMGQRRPVRTTATDERGQRDVICWDRFSELYAMVQRVAAEQGCYVPDPDPFHGEAV